jgi:ABC-type lipoprotein export system ATPase subunit
MLDLEILAEDLSKDDSSDTDEEIDLNKPELKELNDKSIVALRAWDNFIVGAHSLENAISGSQNVIDLANKFTGESISKESKVTELSGGQTRALLFADAILIGASPIILVDEIENAGINKTEILKYVKRENKLVIFATHDPSIVLQTEKRILMKNGAISQIIEHTKEDKEVLDLVLKADKTIKKIQDKIRNGTNIDILKIKDDE